MAYFCEAVTPITPFPFNTSVGRKCPVAAAMVFRDEAPYLKEWIEYHRLIGIEHFYLYNNLSQDDFLDVLLPYIKEGVVELFDYPELLFNISGSYYPNQVVTYEHALAIARDNNDWLAIIDSDEFICLVADYSLPDFLKKYSLVGGLCIFWQVYGTSGVHSLKPGELLIEKLVMKMNPKAYEGSVFKTYKSIVRPKRVKEMPSAHHANYYPKWFGVYPDFNIFRPLVPYVQELPIDEIRVNHYTWRTEEYFYNVKLPRMNQQGYQPGSSLIPDSIEELMESSNAIEDRIMDKYIPLLKQAIFGE
jgi:hypothetical protein